MASAANLNGEAESPATSPISAAPRRDAVALEVDVNATGTRPTQGDASRELFSEDTATVLIFPDGALIRLSSAVLQGQLIFLTHKQTNREVVCQVFRKRSSTPAGSYVELQFTESQNDFWGVKFEKTSSAPPPEKVSAPSPEAEAAAAGAVEFVLESPFVVDDEGGAPSAAPSAGEVELLREEVAALRHQLLSLQSAPPALPPPAPIIRMSLPAAPPAFLDQVLREQLPSSSSLSEPRFREDHANKLGSEEDSLDGLLPSPDLDFSATPFKAFADQNASPSLAAPGPRSGKLLRILVALLLVVAGLGVAWSLRLPPFRRSSPQPASLKASASNSPETPSSTSHISDASKPSLETQENSSGFSSSTSSDAAPETSSPPESLPTALPHSPDGAAKQPARDSSIPRSPLRATKSTASSSASLPARPEVDPDDAPILPAKLLKSVPPVYPPDAIRNFITGDVRLDALVDANGHVKSVTVIAGPSQLRQAAIDAFKQYQYSPATKGPRPVDSHVTVTIKFWYNP